MPRYSHISDALKSKFDYYKITEEFFNRIAAHVPETTTAEAICERLYTVMSYHRSGGLGYLSDYEFKIFALENVDYVTPNLSDDEAASLACFAALCGNAEALKLILEKYPRAARSAHRHLNIAHAAAIADNYNALTYVLYTYPELAQVKSEIQTSFFSFGTSVKDFAKDRYIKALNGVSALQYRDKILASEPGWEKLLVELKKLRNIEESHMTVAKTAYRECVDFHIPRLQRLLKCTDPAATLQTLITLKNNGIEEAATNVDPYLGAAALEKGKLIKSQFKPDSFGWYEDFVKSRNFKIMYAHFTEAVGYGNANAYFQLGECYHKGIYVESNLELAFAYYFGAAMRGDAQGKAMLTVPGNDVIYTSLRDHEKFLKMVYQGLLSNNHILLKKAAASYPAKMKQFAIASNFERDPLHHVLLLKSTMNDKRSDAQLNNALFDLLSVELNKAKNTTNKLQFLLDVKAILTPVHFSEVCILLLDSMKLKDATSRMAVLKVLSSVAGSTEMQQVITAHLKTIDMKVQTECVRAFAEVIVKRESDPVMVHVIETASSSSTSSSSSSAVQSVEEVTPNTLPTYPSLAPQPVYQNAAPNTVLFSTPVPPAEPAPQMAAVDVDEPSLDLPNAPKDELEGSQVQTPEKKQEKRESASPQFS